MNTAEDGAAEEDSSTFVLGYLDLFEVIDRKKIL